MGLVWKDFLSWLHCPVSSLVIRLRFGNRDTERKGGGACACVEGVAVRAGEATSDTLKDRVASVPPWRLHLCWEL